MATISSDNTTASPLNAQPKSIRNAFIQRLLKESVDAETMRQKLVVKESLTQAFRELKEAETSGVELPDARKLFK